MFNSLDQMPAYLNAIASNKVAYFQIIQNLTWKYTTLKSQKCSWQ